jgi:hypothetical protein
VIEKVALDGVSAVVAVIWLSMIGTELEDFNVEA